MLVMPVTSESLPGNGRAECGLDRYRARLTRTGIVGAAADDLLQVDAGYRPNDRLCR